MKVIYFGHQAANSTSRQRADALQRIGCDVSIRDPYATFCRELQHPLLSKIHFRSGYRLLQSQVARWLHRELGSFDRPDLIWVDNGELFGPACLQALRTAGCPIVLYAIDDAPGGRDGRRFDSMLAALGLYDLCATVRSATVSDFQKRGAQRVLRIWMSYDEIAHAPYEDASQIPGHLLSEVAFVGTWMRYEKRDWFLLQLENAGVPFNIWGDRWQKSPVWKSLEASWRGNSLSGRDYVAAIQGAKICLGLLSKGNRDLHTTRSLEVPYAGGLLCAERTVEHQQLYREDVEAVFWTDVDECAEKCRWLLDHPVEREAIRTAGMRRVRELKMGNEDVCRFVLESVGSVLQGTVSTRKSVPES